MPQLMPLTWISSSFMVFLLFFVFMNLYYMNIYSELGFNYDVLFKENYKMEW